MQRFHFKQFSVRHDRSAIKVGTDAVLLGAWTHYAGAKRILDIGTGCGVLALIAAQRNADARIDAVEIDPASAEEATENTDASPWPDRVRIHNMDVRKLSASEPFDLIISNPPFYAGEEASPDARKSVAKHGGELSLEELVVACDRLLSPQGAISMILPAGRSAEMTALAKPKGLGPKRRCAVHYVAQRPAKRVLLELCRGASAPQETTLIVEQTGNKDFTAAYRGLLSDLMLNF